MLLYQQTGLNKVAAALHAADMLIPSKTTQSDIEAAIRSLSRPRRLLLEKLYGLQPGTTAKSAQAIARETRKFLSFVQQDQQIALRMLWTKLTS